VVEATVDIGEERIVAGFVTHAEIGPVGVSEARTMQALTNASLVVVDGGNVAVRGHVIHEEFQGFATSLDASVEF
jgi:hypothetical protein